MLLFSIGNLQGWNASAINVLAMLSSAIIVIVMLKDIVSGIGPLGYALRRWRGGIALEHNLSSARLRNSILTASVLPFLIIADRAQIYNPSWMQHVSLGWTLVVRGAVFGLYLLLRRAASEILCPQKLDEDALRALRMCIPNFSIPATWGLAIIFSISSLLGSDMVSLHGFTVVFICIFFAVSLLYERKILRSEYGPLGTFLYLCGLELAPASIIAVSTFTF